MFKLVELSTNNATASFIGQDGQFYQATHPDFSLVPSVLSKEALLKAQALASSKNIYFNQSASASRFIKATQKVTDIDRSYQLVQSLPEPLPHIENPTSARAKIHKRLEEKLRANDLTPSFMALLNAFHAVFGLSSASKNMLARVDDSSKLRPSEAESRNKVWDNFADEYLGMVHSVLISRGKHKEAKFALVQLQKNLSPEAEQMNAKAIADLYKKTHPNPHRDQEEESKPWQRQMSTRPNPFKGQKKKWL